jgi:hypothetical protein
MLAIVLSSTFLESVISFGRDAVYGGRVCGMPTQVFLNESICGCGFVSKIRGLRAGEVHANFSCEKCKLPDIRGDCVIIGVAFFHSRFYMHIHIPYSYGEKERYPSFAFRLSPLAPRPRAGLGWALLYIYILHPTPYVPRHHDGNMYVPRSIYLLMREPL